MKQIFVLFFLIMMTGIVLAQVEVSLPEIDISEPQGTVVEISVDVGMLTGLNVIAYQFDIIFDQGIIIPAEPYFAVSGTVSNMPGWTIMENPNEPGKLTIGAFGAVPLEGSGTLINLIFQVVSDTGTSPLSFDSFLFNNGTPEAAMIDGSFTNDYSLPPITVELPHVHISVPAGHVLDIPITAENLTGSEVIAYQFTVAFDHSILVPEEPYFNTTGTISNAPGWTVMGNAAVEGQLTIGAFGPAALEGSGTLLNLVFSVMADHGSSQLVFTSFVFNAGTPHASKVNGSFTNQYSDLPPNNNVVENISITEGESVCFDALESIFVSYFTVQAGGGVTFIAGEKIVFQEGTMIMNNAYMHASITKDGTFCFRPVSMLVSEKTHREDDFFEYSGNEHRQVIKLWPNPTRGNVTVGLLSEDGSSKQYAELYNMMGERLIRASMTGYQQYKLNLTNLPKGLYIVRVLVDNEMYVEKLIKH